MAVSSGGIPAPLVLSSAGQPTASARISLASGQAEVSYFSPSCCPFLVGPMGKGMRVHSLAVDFLCCQTLCLAQPLYQM